MQRTRQRDVSGTANWAAENSVDTRGGVAAIGSATLIENPVATTALQPIAHREADTSWGTAIDGDATHMRRKIAANAASLEARKPTVNHAAPDGV